MHKYHILCSVVGPHDHPLFFHVQLMSGHFRLKAWHPNEKDPYSTRPNTSRLSTIARSGPNQQDRCPWKRSIVSAQSPVSNMQKRNRKNKFDVPNANGIYLTSIWYCAFIKEDLQSPLEECDPKNFKSYLHWLLDNYVIMKKCTLWTYWNFVRLLYWEKTKRHMDDTVGSGLKDVWMLFIAKTTMVLTDRSIPMGS